MRLGKKFHVRGSAHGQKVTVCHWEADPETSTWKIVHPRAQKFGVGEIDIYFIYYFVSILMIILYYYYMLDLWHHYGISTIVNSPCLFTPCFQIRDTVHHVWWHSIVFLAHSLVVNLWENFWGLLSLLSKLKQRCAGGDCSDDRRRQLSGIVRSGELHVLQEAAGCCGILTLVILCCVLSYDLLKCSSTSRDIVSFEKDPSELFVVFLSCQICLRKCWEQIS